MYFNHFLIRYLLFPTLKRAFFNDQLVEHFQQHFVKLFPLIFLFAKGADLTATLLPGVETVLAEHLIASAAGERFVNKSHADVAGEVIRGLLGV